MKSPNLIQSIANYRDLAAGYDRNCTRVMPLREEAIARLALQPGDVVVDVASGTGLSFPLLMSAIGPQGRLIAIESSPDMMALARQRVADAGWRNVTLIERSADDAEIPIAFDAVLFHFTHDVMQSPHALSRIFASAKSGARIAVAGAKLRSWWLAPVNFWMLWRGRRYLTTFTGLREPWAGLLRYVPDLSVESRLVGTAYVGAGTVVQNAQWPASNGGLSVRVPALFEREHPQNEVRL